MTTLTITVNFTLPQLKEKYRLHFGYPENYKVYKKGQLYMSWDKNSKKERRSIQSAVSSY